MIAVCGWDGNLHIEEYFPAYLLMDRVRGFNKEVPFYISEGCAWGLT
jgi:hypothetical protein